MPGDPVEPQLNQLAAPPAGSMGDVQAMAASWRGALWPRPAAAGRGNTCQLPWQSSVSTSAFRSRNTRSGFRRASSPACRGRSASSAFDADQLQPRHAARRADGMAAGAALRQAVGAPLMLASAVPYFLVRAGAPVAPVDRAAYLSGRRRLPFSMVPRFDIATGRGILSTPRCRRCRSCSPRPAPGRSGCGNAGQRARRGLHHARRGQGTAAASNLLRYGLRNALLPQLTNLALTLGHLSRARCWSR